MIREYMDKWAVLTDWERQDAARDLVVVATFTIVLFLSLALVLGMCLIYKFQIL